MLTRRRLLSAVATYQLVPGNLQKLRRPLPGGPFVRLVASRLCHYLLSGLMSMLHFFDCTVVDTIVFFNASAISVLSIYFSPYVCLASVKRHLGSIQSWALPAV